MPRVSVCVPVHRQHAPPNVGTLAAALPAALGALDGELVVALNGLGREAAGVPDGVRTVPLGLNLGVAPGWNAAAREATGDVLVFANDDLQLAPGSLERLVGVLDGTPDAGVVGPAGAIWDRRAWQHDRTVHAGPGDLVPCDAVSGFLFATRRGTWAAVGGFDDAYAPASWEEIDFNVAVQQTLGLRSYVVGGLGVDHDWGISARQRPWKTVTWGGRRELLWAIHRRNRRHFLAKWAA